MKCARRFDAEVVDFIFLSPDYRKLVYACSDRNLEFHAQFGKHHKVRHRIASTVEVSRYTARQAKPKLLTNFAFQRSFSSARRGVKQTHFGSQMMSQISELFQHLAAKYFNAVK